MVGWGEDTRPRAMPIIGSQLRSSVTRSDHISASRSAYAWSGSCWPRGIIVSRETVRQWALIRSDVRQPLRRRVPRVGNKWHLYDVALKIAGVKHWLWRAVDQTGIVLDVLVQRRRGKPLGPRGPKFQVRVTPAGGSGGDNSLRRAPLFVFMQMG